MLKNVATSRGWDIGISTKSLDISCNFAGPSFIVKRILMGFDHKTIQMLQLIYETVLDLHECRYLWLYAPVGFHDFAKLATTTQMKHMGKCWRPIAIPKQIERVGTWKSAPWKHMSIFKWDYYAWFSTCWQQDPTSVSWIVLSYSLRAWTKSESDLMWILKTHAYTNIWWIMKVSKLVLSSF